MSKQIIFDPWTNHYMTVDSEQAEKIANAIDKIQKENGITTTSNTEMVLINQIIKIKRLKENYVKLKEKAKHIEDVKEQRFAWERALMARDILLKAIDEIDI